MNQSRPDPLIRIRGASKRFGATQALDRVDLDVPGGSVLALLGQNGAGKSTLIKVLAGVYELDAGSVTVCGHDLGTAEARPRIAFVHQDLGLVGELSIAENVALGAEYPRRRGLIDWSSAHDKAARALRLVACDIDPRTRVSELSRTERSLVAIARALVLNSEVLVLDEPTASLPVDETERLFGVLRSLRDSGLGVVYVSHRLDEVFAIADRVTVLRDGRVVANGDLEGMSSDELVSHIVGGVPTPQPPLLTARDRPVVLTLEELIGTRVGPVSLSVREGEVVGLVGLAGAGHVELGRTVCGALPRYGGEMSLGGQRYRPRRPFDAVARGVAFVTSNRAEEGLGLSLTVRENLLPNPRARGLRGWRLRSNRAESRLARELVKSFGIRPADPELTAEQLSGGNQQKILLGRWLSIDVTLLVLEDPTAGVDVGAKHEIYRLMRDVLARGSAALLISTDFEEVANVCHRAIVFRDGRVVTTIAGDQLTVRSLVAHASGAAG